MTIWNVQGSVAQLKPKRIKICFGLIYGYQMFALQERKGARIAEDTLGKTSVQYYGTVIYPP